MLTLKAEASARLRRGFVYKGLVREGLKKCKKFDDILFINASQHFIKDGRLNRLRDGEDDEPNDIRKIVDTYQNRPEHIERYARRVSMEEIEKNDFNLKYFTVYKHFY